MKAAALVLLVVLVAPEALANDVGERFALVIGNNRGEADEVELRFAEDDADKVVSLLTEMGAFPAENVTLLRGADVDSVRRALASLEERIARTKEESVLLIYYSGHADALGLHLGRRPYPLQELEAFVRASRATFRVVVLDACRSGTLTRVKGGAAIAPFAIDIEPVQSLRAEGVAFVASTAANEDAQESDELRGSFFTHYLVSGLMGPADRDKDDAVSLREAYDFAYSHTLRASSRTRAGLQHPTFNYEIKGRSDLVLTRILSKSDRATLQLPPGANHLVLAQGREGHVVAEVGADVRAPMVSLRAGQYFVRSRAPDHLLEGEVSLSPGAAVDLGQVPMRKTAYARLVRKGASEQGWTSGPDVSVGYRSPLLGSRPAFDRELQPKRFPALASSCWGVRANWGFDFENLSLAPRAGFCAGRSSATLPPDHEVEVGLRLARVFDFPLVSLEAGVAAGAVWLLTSRDKPNDAVVERVLRTTLLGELAVEGRASSELGEGFNAGLDASVLTYLGRVQTVAANGAEIRGLTPLFGARVGLFIGKRF